MKKFQISTISKRTSYWAILLIWLIFISINTYSAPSGMDLGVKFLWSFVNSVYYFLFVWVNINWYRISNGNCTLLDANGITL